MHEGEGEGEGVGNERKKKGGKKSGEEEVVVRGKGEARRLLAVRRERARETDIYRYRQRKSARGRKEWGRQTKRAKIITNAENKHEAKVTGIC